MSDKQIQKCDRCEMNVRIHYLNDYGFKTRRNGICNKCKLIDEKIYNKREALRIKRGKELESELEMLRRRMR